MYVYVDGQTVATKVTDMGTGPEFAFPEGCNIKAVRCPSQLRINNMHNSNIIMNNSSIRSRQIMVKDRNSRRNRRDRSSPASLTSITRRNRSADHSAYAAHTDTTTASSWHPAAGRAHGQLLAEPKQYSDDSSGGE